MNKEIEILQHNIDMTTQHLNGAFWMYAELHPELNGFEVIIAVEKNTKLGKHLRKEIDELSEECYKKCEEFMLNEELNERN